LKESGESLAPQMNKTFKSKNPIKDYNAGNLPLDYKIIDFANEK